MKFMSNRSKSAKNVASSSSTNDFKSTLQQQKANSTRGDTAQSALVALFNSPLQEDTIERVRVTIKDAHIFKLPPRQSSGGYRGADWKDKFWQGIVKVIERNDHCAIVLIDRLDSSIFAVCPYTDGAVDRCVDSRYTVLQTDLIFFITLNDFVFLLSRYFVLRVESEDGRRMFIGMAFNERNDAFDFNAALEDVKREREMIKVTSDKNNSKKGPSVDYSIKDGHKIHVSIPKRNDEDIKKSNNATIVKSLFGEKSTKKKVGKEKGSLFLAPSSRDTPSRIQQKSD